MQLCLIVVRYHTHKFISAIAHGDRIVRAVLPDDSCDTADCKISHIMSEIIVDIFQMVGINKHDPDRFFVFHILIKHRQRQLFICHTIIKPGKGIVDVKLRKLPVFLSENQLSVERFDGSTEGVQCLEKKLMRKKIIAVFENQIANFTFAEMNRSKEIYVRDVGLGAFRK